ncbi:MAG: DUF4349 domain-containing protein [Sandaracinus sp.]
MTRCALAVVLSLLAMPGCAAGARYREATTSTGSVALDGYAATAALPARGDYGDALAGRSIGEPFELSGLGGGGDASGGEEGERTEARSGATTPEPMLAQAETSLVPPEPEATDAVDTSGSLLVYTALFHVAVYDVDAGQAQLAERARGVGGFVFAETDDTIVVRVPAARFLAFMADIDAGYDVLHREVQAQDVGDEFRDIEVRLANLQAERDGIAALLERGLSVEQVLVVERELERVTTELEQMRARQRFLADRIAFSTLTVMFRPAPREAIDQPDVFQLPFDWLDQLGLASLVDLR